MHDLEADQKKFIEEIDIEYIQSKSVENETKNIIQKKA